MPEFSLPFDSIAGDEREYPAEQFVQYLKPLINTGIHTDPGTLKVEHVDGMTLQVNTGYAWLEGYVYRLYDVPLQLTLEQAHGSLDRIDRIVIRLDLTLPVRSINAKILKGEPSSNPEPPALTRDANVFELSLAQVRVVGGQNFIDPANITDERGDDELCPWITSNILPDITDALQDVIDMVEERIPLDQKGAPNGVATLDTDGKVTINQLRQNVTKGSYSKTITLPKRTGSSSPFTYTIETVIIPIGSDVQEVQLTAFFGTTRLGYIHIFRNQPKWVIAQRSNYQVQFLEIAETNHNLGSTITGVLPTVVVGNAVFGDVQIADIYFSGSDLIIKVANMSENRDATDLIQINYLKKE